MKAMEPARLYQTVGEAASGRSANCRAARHLAQTIGLAVALMGLVVLLGWVLNVKILKAVVPGLATMKANTAIGFVLTGVGLALLSYPREPGRGLSRARGCALFVIALSLATLAEYLFGLNLGIDELLFRDPQELVPVKLPNGRPGFTTALSFLMTGFALLLIRGPSTVAAQFLACLAGLTAAFSVAGYLFREEAIIFNSQYTSMAIHTALGFVALTVGLLATAPPRGPVAVLLSSTRSGMMARRLLPAALLVTMGLGALGVTALRAGWLGPGFGMTLFALTTATVLGSLNWYVACQALKLEEATRAQEDQIRRLNGDLERRVAERTAALEAARATLVQEADERQRAEEEARLEGLRFRSLIEATTVMVWTTPPSGEMETEQVGWSRFTGQTFEQYKGWGWLEAVHPDDRALTANAWCVATANRSLYQVDHRMRRHDGEYRYLQGWAVPIRSADGTVREWFGVHTDVDAEKKVQVEMQQTKEAAEAANKAKSEFLANMSHEIRTPMNAILGLTSLVLETDLTRDQRDSLTMVSSSADALLTVINEILDFSKIEANKLDLDLAPFALRSAIEDTLQALALKAHAKGLELAFDIRPEVPDGLIGDAGRLRQVLTNLVGNAIKFTETGEILVRISLVPTPNSPPCLPPCQDIRLHFVVQDTGIGISPRKARPDLQCLHASRWIDHPALRRDGAGSDDFVAAGGAHGGAHWDRERIGTGQHVPL